MHVCAKTLGSAAARLLVFAGASLKNALDDIALTYRDPAKAAIVASYGGSAALRLAMERGEIEGFCGVGYNSMRTAGLLDGRANILVQVGLAKLPDSDIQAITDYLVSLE